MYYKYTYYRCRISLNKEIDRIRVSRVSGGKYMKYLQAKTSLGWKVWREAPYYSLAGLHYDSLALARGLHGSTNPQLVAVIRC